MKYICLGYLEPGKFENMSESERNTMLDECFRYNGELRKERTFGRRGTSSARQHGDDRVLDEREGCSDGRSVRGNEGAIGWNSGAGSARSESRHSAHFPISGSEVELRNDRDTSSGGYKGNLVGFSDEAILRLLGEGIAHTGAPPQSPMPPFRMNRADATAIVAYLRSLK